MYTVHLIDSLQMRDRESARRTVCNSLPHKDSQKICRSRNTWRTNEKTLYVENKVVRTAGCYGKLSDVMPLQLSL